MQPCKIGDQPYSDASPNGECSLVEAIQTFTFIIKVKILVLVL